MPQASSPTVRISGRVYPERPSSRGSERDRLRRLLSIASSLKFASEACSEMERRLYKSILEVRAYAENMVEQARGERAVEPELYDLTRPDHEP